MCSGYDPSVSGVTKPGGWVMFKTVEYKYTRIFASATQNSKTTEGLQNRKFNLFSVCKLMLPIIIDCKKLQKKDWKILRKVWEA